MSSNNKFPFLVVKQKFEDRQVQNIFDVVIETNEIIRKKNASSDLNLFKSTYSSVEQSPNNMKAMKQFFFQKSPKSSKNGDKQNKVYLNPSYQKQFQTSRKLKNQSCMQLLGKNESSESSKQQIVQGFKDQQEESQFLKTKSSFFGTQSAFFQSQNIITRTKTQQPINFSILSDQNQTLVEQSINFLNSADSRFLNLDRTQEQKEMDERIKDDYQKITYAANLNLEKYRKKFAQNEMLQINYQIIQARRERKNKEKNATETNQDLADEVYEIFQKRKEKMIQQSKNGNVINHNKQNVSEFTSEKRQKKLEENFIEKNQHISDVYQKKQIIEAEQVKKRVQNILQRSIIRIIKSDNSHQQKEKERLQYISLNWLRVLSLLKLMFLMRRKITCYKLMKNWYNTEKTVAKTFLQSYRSKLIIRGDIKSRINLDIHNSLHLYASLAEDRAERNMIKIIRGALTQLQGNTVYLKILFNSQARVNAVTKIQNILKSQFELWMKITTKMINKLIHTMKTQDAAIFLNGQDAKTYDYLKYLNYIQNEHIIKIAKKYVQNRRENQRLTFFAFKSKLEEIKQTEEEKVEQKKEDPQLSDRRRRMQHYQSVQLQTTKISTDFYQNSPKLVKDQNSPHESQMRGYSITLNTSKVKDSPLSVTKRMDHLMSQNANRVRTGTLPDFNSSQDNQYSLRKRQASQNKLNNIVSGDRQGDRSPKSPLTGSYQIQSPLKSESVDTITMDSPATASEISKFGLNKLRIKPNATTNFLNKTYAQQESANNTPLTINQGKKTDFFIKMRQQQQITLSMSQLREIPEIIKLHLMKASKTNNYDVRQFTPQLNLSSHEDILKTLIIEKLCKLRDGKQLDN